MTVGVLGINPEIGLMGLDYHALMGKQRPWEAAQPF